MRRWLLRLWILSAERDWPIGFYPSDPADPMRPMFWIRRPNRGWWVICLGWQRPTLLTLE